MLSPVHPELPRSRTDPCGPSLLTLGEMIRFPLWRSSRQPGVSCTALIQPWLLWWLMKIWRASFPGLQPHSITVHFFPPNPKRQLRSSSHPEQCCGHRPHPNICSTIRTEVSPVGFAPSCPQ